MLHLLLVCVGCRLLFFNFLWIYYDFQYWHWRLWEQRRRQGKGPGKSTCAKICCNRNKFVHCFSINQKSIFYVKCWPYVGLHLHWSGLVWWCIKMRLSFIHATLIHCLQLLWWNRWTVWDRFNLGQEINIFLLRKLFTIIIAPSFTILSS